MTFPAFFDDVPPIRMYDPLAEFLGAARGGLMEYRYGDAVRLAGHSCPTVASAWLMTDKALAALYGEALPQRGGVRVAFRDPAEAGVTGVMANVVGMLTGATETTGFKGLAGRFDRRRLLAFGAELDGEIRFTRVDNGRSATVAANLAGLPADARMRPLMARCMAGEASAEEAAEFGRLWQARVRALLIDMRDDPAIMACRLD